MLIEIPTADSMAKLTAENRKAKEREILIRISPLIKKAAQRIEDAALEGENHATVQVDTVDSSRFEITMLCKLLTRSGYEVNFIHGRPTGTLSILWEVKTYENRT